MPKSRNLAGASGHGAPWAPWVILGTICALVIGFYAWSARPGWLGMRASRAADSYYNLLVQGFCAGQLNLKTEVPAGLAHLADPYDPVANADYLLVDGHPMWDLSYYHGKLYLYYGPTPALVLFGPYAVLTGHYLWQKDAVVIFCAIGFLASVGLLCLAWRRYFPETHVPVLAAGALALGLVGFTSIILPRAEIYEVAISCGYALTMLALLALWEACHQPDRRGRWLAVASLAYGLAIGARPNALFGAVILLIPVAQVWRERRRIWTPLLAAAGPITFIGLGLMLYNNLRFDSPLEFGQPYTLSSVRLVTGHLWSHRFLVVNSWIYFLAPAHWSASFPFLRDITLPALPPGYGSNEHPFGVLTSIPLVWLALASPLAWRGRSAELRSLLRGFLAAVALLVATRALILGLFFNANLRYQVDFAPALVLLAAFGILGLERALAGQPAWRWAARGVWGLLLAFSLGFNLLASTIYHAEYYSALGSLLLGRGQVNEAIGYFQKALALQPDDAGVHNNLGSALAKNGKADEAIGQYQEALRLKPDHADAHKNLGAVFYQKGRTDDAISEFQQALLVKPDHAETHNFLGVALGREGRMNEAILQFQEAIRLKPDYTDAHYDLGIVLAELGRFEEAMLHYQEALRLQPNNAQACSRLAVVLARRGQMDEAIRQFRQAIRLKPDDPEPHYGLAVAFANKGQMNDAIIEYQQTLSLKPDDPQVHNNLGIALYQQRRLEEAIHEFQEALRGKPDYADARTNLDVALAAKARSSPSPAASTNR